MVLQPRVVRARCLQGFLHLEGVLDASEVAAANDAIDAHAAEFSTDTPVGTLSRDQPGLRGDSVRAVPTYSPEDGPLGWAEGERDPFRAMLVHERIIPALNGMLGKGFRMVSLPPPTALTEGPSHRRPCGRAPGPRAGRHQRQARGRGPPTPRRHDSV